MTSSTLGPTKCAPSTRSVVYYRITDNWLELTVRFVLSTHGNRTAKDAMSRHIITALDAAGLGIASATYDIVGVPPIEMHQGARPSKSPS